MSRQRKQYSAALKSKVALEAIKGVRSANAIATHYGVHPNQVGQWKKQALEHLQEAFSDGANALSARKRSCKTNSTNKSDNSK